MTTATSELGEVLQHLRRVVLLRDGAGLSDRQLLMEYISRRDKVAFAALVRRHGPMVWGVCRRVLSNYHDAEDAFQANFLVLVRKAASLAAPELLANWLHGVAHQTALKARASAATRRARERQVTEMPEPVANDQDLWNDLQPLLDAEVRRLPAKYRVAILLCDLEGKSRKEAALQLGVPDGTLAARLSRGRVLLAKRLARHGLAMSGGALGVMLAQQAASAGVPAAVVATTMQAASLCAAGQAAMAGVISSQVAALTKGVLTAMLMTRIKIALVGFLVMGALGIGLGALTYQTVAADPAPVASKVSSRSHDAGNLKEIVLALERRIWEAHCKQDVDTFKSLLADDFVGIDMFGRSYEKAGELDYVAKFRVVEHTMTDVKVVLLNATGALVNYQIAYKVRPTNGRQVESTRRRVTAVWTQRKGRWWYVYFEDKLVQENTRAQPWGAESSWRLSDVLREINKAKPGPKEQ
jgi:RNA polymerase sigma factor (sigma-70 family)